MVTRVKIGQSISKISRLAVATTAILLFGGSAQAGDAAKSGDATASLIEQLVSKTDRLPLSGRAGHGLLRPGFAVGEYVGSTKAVGNSFGALGLFHSNSVKASFDVTIPSIGQPVTGDCKGGQSEIVVVIVPVVRDALNYVCSFAGGVPPGTELALVESRSGGLFDGDLTPQRAAAFQFGNIHLRAATKHVAGGPLLGAHAVSYAITRDDGTLIGGYQITNLGQPIFYLPKTPGAERDAVALLAVSLYAFRDPGGMW